jgi:protein-S-isoprenylcysteine O-methyltransferase Ste14
MTSASRTFATTGAGLFAIAIGYFAYAYLVTFGAPVHGPLRPATLAWDTALLAVFGAHHSAFARLPVRRWVARCGSPELERAAYVWIASALLIAICVLWHPLPGISWAFNAPLNWALRGLQALGAWLMFDSVTRIGARELVGLRPSPPPADNSGGTFTTRGPYGWVRHPIHLGLLLFLWGMSPMTTTRLVFASLIGLYVLMAIPLEERSLRAVARDAYDEYARTVRWRLIPGIY